jgi:hypothetical protein
VMNNSHSSSVSACDLNGSFIALHFANSVKRIDDVTLLTAVETFVKQDRNTANVHMHLVNVGQNEYEFQNTLTNHFSSSTSAIPSPISVNLNGTKVLFVCVANNAA